MTTQAQTESVSQKLNVLAKELNARYSHIEITFLIERLVARLIGNTDLSHNLVFKGGFVGLKAHESLRYTVNLDALLMRSNIDQALKRLKNQAESDLGDGVWFRLEDQLYLGTKGDDGGIRHVYRVGIGEILKKAKIINFDPGVRDRVFPRPQKLELKSLVRQEPLIWSVHRIETICAEKLHPHKILR